MARRAGSVVVYQGARGRVFRIRYRDADGRRVDETLGRETDGWTARKAEEALRDRLVDVKRERRRKAGPLTLGDFAATWLETYPAARGLKKSTTAGYRSIVERHLIPALGDVRLEQLDFERIERYLAAQRKAGHGAASLNRDLAVLSLIFKAAIKRGLIPGNANPVPLVDRPKELRRRWTILTPVEVARVAKAFDELADAAPIKREHGAALDRQWIEQARVVFLVIVGCGLRRGELLGLRWRNVRLVEKILRVEETWVRGGVDTPKSEAGERTISIPQRVADELTDHYARSSFKGDDERVFCHPTKGSTLNDKLYAETLRLALARAGVDRPMRPFHDGRHTAITNDALSGNAPAAIQARAGHSSFSTTQRYIDLAGVEFREEADRLGRHLFGDTSGESSGESASPDEAEAPRDRHD